MSLKPQVPIISNETEETLQFIRLMGIKYVNLNLKEEELTEKIIGTEMERLAKFDLEVSDIACWNLQKNKAIHLGLSNRDEEILKFNKMLELLGKFKIAFTSIAWQPNGILRTCQQASAKTRGGISMYADEDEILSRPNAEARAYTEDEIWENFKYFLEKVIPVAEKTGVRMALHPNDPPLACMAGIPSLIWNSDCYRRAFELANDSPALGVKLCVGCWLEGGEKFGDLMQDIKEFCGRDKILCIHFRNVDSTLPKFQEVLSEDGYADMYAIMKKLVECDCNAVISIDHAYKAIDGFGGMMGSFAYPTGHMKGLLEAAERELRKI